MRINNLEPSNESLIRVPSKKNDLSLPPELWKIICSYLTDPADRVRFSRTSLFGHTIITDYVETSNHFWFKVQKFAIAALRPRDTKEQRLIEYRKHLYEFRVFLKNTADSLSNEMFKSTENFLNQSSQHGIYTLVISPAITSTKVFFPPKAFFKAINQLLPDNYQLKSQNLNKNSIINYKLPQWCQFKKNPTHKRLIVNSIQKML